MPRCPYSVHYRSRNTHSGHRSIRGGYCPVGAVPPVYDTTRLPLDRGIHVHARNSAGRDKVIDDTFRAVRLTSHGIPKEGLLLSEIDAIYFMVSSIFGFDVSDIRCTLCGYPHLDKDWFSVHPHRRHLCAGCGHNFRDSRVAIGNPVHHLQEACGIAPRPSKKSTKLPLHLSQQDYPGGIQIWGSNPAIVWSANGDEEEGIHIHAFGNSEKPLLDDTFPNVTVDGVDLDPVMVRTLMAQNALPHIQGRVTTLTCVKCGEPQFHTGADAFTPATDRKCTTCGGEIRGSSRLRKTISNPLVSALDRLASNAPRVPQKHKLDLLPETL
jgi:hypothetical protein